MESDYSKLKDFWNQLVSDEKIEPVSEKWINFDKFNEIINTYLKDNDTVLDYGCGSGWGLIELNFTKKIKSGIGIDTANNSIDYANKLASVSNLNNVTFICGDEHLLVDYLNHFDFAISINTLDVVPDEITDSILSHIRFSLKENGYFFVGLNPDFTEDELLNMIHMEKSGHYFYKNGILRANKKSIEQWTNLFKEYFKVVDTFKFIVVEQESKYPRVGFILQKKVNKKHIINNELTGEDIDMFNEKKYEDNLLDDND